MKYVGVVAAVLFVATVWIANWFIGNVGDQPFPGGPHVIPVGFGYEAPSGVLFVGLAFVLRDTVHRILGRWVVVGCIVLGAGLSYFIAPSFALASGLAFFASEMADLGVYTPLRRRSWFPAVVASNTVGAVVDSVIFLWLAFGSLQFIEGQIIGKLWMTVPAVILLASLGARREQVA